MTILIPKGRRPITPGETLREDFLEPMGLSQGRLAEVLDVDRFSVSEIVNGRRSVTPEMALRLGHAFGVAPQYWLNAQLAVDLYDAMHSPMAEEVSRLEVLVHPTSHY